MPSDRRLIWLPEALQDLQRLDDFLRQHDPRAANRFLRRVVDAVGSLRQFPEIGRPFEPAMEFRELFVTFGARGYVVRYRIDREATVIVRVWHALEDR